MPIHWDLTLNPTSIIAVLGMLWALLRLANRNQIDDAVTKRLDAYDENIKAVLVELRSTDREHQKSDDKQFKEIADRLSDIRVSIAGAVEAHQQYLRLEEKVVNLELAQRQISQDARTEARYAKEFRHYVRNCLEAVIVPVTVLCTKAETTPPRLPPQPPDGG